MKRIGNLLLVSSLSLAFGVKSVSAQTFNDGDAHSLSRGNYITINSLDVGSANYGIYKYTFDNGKYVGYCEDPQNFSGKKYSVSRELGATTNGKTIQNMDAGLLKIISEGYNQYNTSKTISVVTPESAPNAISITLSGDELYAATSIAVRAYSTGLFTTGAKGAKYQSAIDMASAHANLGAQWAALYGEYTDNATYGSCNGDSNCYKNKVDYAWLNKNAMFNYSDPNSASYKIIYMAQQLFKAGVINASNKATGSLLTTTVNIEFSKKTESINKTDTSEEKYVYATLKIENLPEKLSDGKEGKVELSMPTCTGCTINSFEAQDGGDYKQVGIGNNIALLLEAKDGVRTGEIKLRIKVTQAVQDQENCKDATLKIDFKYNTNPQLTGATLSDKSNPNSQRFFVLDKQEGDQTGSAQTKIGCSKAACDTEITEPLCDGDAIATVKAPDKIKSCVINNVDDADNSYQYTSGVDNKYCKVYCKEDYAKIQLEPVVKDIKCGSYFKLTSRIEGSKSCYTGGETDASARNGEKSIDKDQYIQDVIDAQKTMIEGLNLYRKAKQALATASDYSISYGCDGCSAESWTRTGSYVGPVVTNIDYEEGFVTSQETTQGFFYGTKESISNNTSYDSETKRYVCVSSTCTPGTTEAQVIALIKADMAKGKSMMESGFKAYEAAHTAYNACTTGWQNNFLFEQKIGYYYNENRGNDEYKSPYYDILESAQNKDLYYLEGTGSAAPKPTSKIEIWKKATDDKIETGSDYTFDLSIENGSTGKYNYKSSYGGTFEARKYTVCKNPEGSCEIREEQISQAAFVKKYVEKEQDYITPTAFYQIAANGKITVNSGYTGDKVQLEALINSLPVSTKTVGGGIFKLNIEWLGEFYDKDNAVGRLMDIPGVAWTDRRQGGTTFMDSSKHQDSFTGDYKCYYESPCRPDDCPNCDFVCEGEDCDWIQCPECKIDCTNCIFDLNKLNVNFRTISTTNFNSANRTYGYNWITSSSMQALQLLNKKADATIKEIEEVNESIYDPEGKTSDGSSALALSIKLTPQAIRELKNYNEKHSSDGGYINDSLTCYDAEVNGKTYKNIYCYSEVIDDLVKNYEVTIPDGKRLDSETARAASQNQNGYWELWSDKHEFIYSESVIGGPSWK